MPLKLPSPPALPALIPLREPEGASEAIIFVHGLGGDLYTTWGAKGSPATFITRLADAFPKAAVYSCGYSTGVKRVLHFSPKKLDFEELAEIWRGYIRDALLHRHSSVAIVCHSLGGVLTMTALRQLATYEKDFELGLQEGESNLTLFMMGVPQHGTQTRGTGWFNRELKVLTYNDKVVRDNTEFWQSRMRQPEDARIPDHIPVAVYAVVSKADHWVPQLSAGDNLSESHIRRFEHSHTDMVKPPETGDFGPYDFVLSRLRARFDTPGLPKHIQDILDRNRSGLNMVFDRVQIDRVVERPWLDIELKHALSSRESGYIHLSAQAGAGKTAYLAKLVKDRHLNLVKDRDLVSFFFDRSQGVTGVEELHNALWAQLVACGRLPPTARPEGLGTDARVLRELLEKATAQQDANPLLLAVDGLDEADAAALLPVLPPGVHGITTARPDTPAPRQAITIAVEVEGPDSQADIRRYADRRCAEADLAELAANGGITTGRLAELVSDKAAGLFVFAHFVFTDLAEGRLSLEELEELGPGLEEYYALTWNRWKETQTDRFRNIMRPALAALVVARQAISADLVAAWTSIEPDDVEECLLNDLRPWVTGARTGSDARFRLYHQSVRDFFLQQARAATERIQKASCAHLLNTIADRGSASEEFTGYADAHAVDHLIEQVRTKEASELLLDIEFLDRHRAAVGNGPILAELFALHYAPGKSPDDPISSLFHAWADESFAITDTATLLSQLSYRVLAQPRLAEAIGESFSNVERRHSGPCLRCTAPVSARSSSASVVLTGHEGWVNHCVLSSDGRRLVSASNDRTLRVWDLANGKEIARFRAVSFVNWVGWGADSNRIYAADRSGRVWFFELCLGH